jgi:hypothetical protein
MLKKIFKGKKDDAMTVREYVMNIEDEETRKEMMEIFQIKEEDIKKDEETLGEKIDNGIKKVFPIVGSIVLGGLLTLAAFVTVDKLTKDDETEDDEDEDDDVIDVDYDVM